MVVRCYGGGGVGVTIVNKENLIITPLLRGVAVVVVVWPFVAVDSGGGVGVTCVVAVVAVFGHVDGGGGHGGSDGSVLKSGLVRFFSLLGLNRNRNRF